MSTSPGRKAFLAHLAVYLVVNAVLFAINATQALEPGETREWWAIWPLIGWGIGIAAHAFAEWAEARSGEGQLLADQDIRGVAVHLFVYLAVNAFLIVVNLTTSPETLWSIWPLLGWGLGLAAHAWLVYRAVLRKTMELYATEQRLLTEMQLEAQAADIAAAIEKPAKKKAPATRKRRKQAAAKTTKKRAARRGTAAKRPAKTTARKKPAPKPAGSSRKKS
jgi:hypothetical protein